MSHLEREMLATAIKELLILKKEKKKAPFLQTRDCSLSKNGHDMPIVWEQDTLLQLLKMIVPEPALSLMTRAPPGMRHSSALYNCTAISRGSLSEVPAVVITSVVVPPLQASKTERDGQRSSFGCVRYFCCSIFAVGIFCPKRFWPRTNWPKGNFSVRKIKSCQIKEGHENWITKCKKTWLPNTNIYIHLICVSVHGNTAK